MGASVGKYLIKGGRLVDPKNHVDGIRDVLICGKKIERIAEEISDSDAAAAGARTISAKGKVVMPGFVDLHVHLREPGFEYKETIMTGAAAAARGGVTSICPMPNTSPVIDSPERVKDLIDRAKGAPVNIFPIGAVTVGQGGRTVTDIAGMKEAGAVAISEDGKSVASSGIFMSALIEAAKADIPVFSHCEDDELAGEGVMNLGKKSEELGLIGIPNAAEDVIIARDIILAKEAGARLHLCHCSTADGTFFVEMAKMRGLRVTAEACPHHFALSDDEIASDDGRFKMNPPLRSAKDVAAIKDALKKGTIDIISTDHAPHGLEEKSQSMRYAPFGITGLETSFAIGYTTLVMGGYLTLSQLVEKMSVNPAGVIGLDRGSLAQGKTADVVIADIESEYRIDTAGFASKGKSTPFDKMTVRGRIEKTFTGGRLVYDIDA